MMEIKRLKVENIGSGGEKKSKENSKRQNKMRERREF